MIFIWILVAIMMFSLIILFHELGHFLSARKFWVKVHEFWLGIPPRAKALFTDKKWTIFSLNWLPLWGFVRLKWEDLNELEDKNDPEALINKTYIQKSIILLGWVFMNFLLAIIVFSVLFFVWVKPIAINTKIETSLENKIIPTVEHALESWLLIDKWWVILSPVEWSLAEKSWIQKWDILTSVWNVKIHQPEALITIISSSKNSPLSFSITREPKCPECPKWSVCKPCASAEVFNVIVNVWEDWKIWAYVWANIKLNEDFQYKYWALDSIKYWFLETYNQSLLTLKWLSILLQKIFNPTVPEERQEAIKEMKGPIWIVDLVANSLEAWVIFIIIIGAIISINLGVFNLLPIPALDWWRWLLISINSFIEYVFGRKAINEATENVIHVFFFVLLIALSLIIWYNDVSNILERK